MAIPTLVISNPLHGAVDAPLAGRVLDILAAEAGLKANDQVPEIWLAPDDPAQARVAALRPWPGPEATRLPETC